MGALGDYIGGSFRAPEGHPLVSVNPAKDGAPVFTTAWSEKRVDEACAAAAQAAPAWARLSRRERWEVLLRFKDAIKASAKELADAIVLESGKIRSEAAQ